MDRFNYSQRNALGAVRIAISVSLYLLTAWFHRRFHAQRNTKVAGYPQGSKGAREK